jgi:cytochrome c-type biogenesis protein CcmH
MQQRYDALIDELRCPQCLNTNLAGSDAMIAQDLRREVHRMLMDGKSDQEILNFMYERYGDFILYRPKFGVRTALLWLGPALFLLLAFAVLFRMMTRKTEISRISDEDQARLDHLLGDTDKS